MKPNIRTIRHKSEEVMSLRKRGYSLDKIITLVNADRSYTRRICHEYDLYIITLKGIQIGHKDIPYYEDENEYGIFPVYDFKDLSIQEKTIYDKIKTKKPLNH